MPNEYSEESTTSWTIPFGAPVYDSVRFIYVDPPQKLNDSVNKPHEDSEKK